MITALILVGIMALSMCVFMARYEARTRRGKYGISGGNRRSSDPLWSRGYTEREVPSIEKTEEI